MFKILGSPQHEWPIGVCAEYVYVCACVHTCMYIHTYVAICSNVSGEVFGGTRSRVEK